jgi:transporter family protein
MSTALISLLSGIAGMFGWGIYDFFAGVYSKKIGPFKTCFWSQLSGLLCMSALFGIFFPSPGLSILALVLLVAASLCYAGGYLFFMKGFEIGNISIVAAIMNLWAVFTMLVAFLFMGQRLSSIQLAGVILIIVGAVLASLNWNEIRNQKQFKLSAGVKETVAGAFFFGIFWNISEIVSEQIGWLPTTFFIKLFIIVFLYSLSMMSRRELGIAKEPARTKWMILLIGCIEALAVAVVNYGLTIGDAILITPIASALSIVTITMAILFLKDRVSRLQAVGMATAVSGIIVTGF